MKAKDICISVQNFGPIEKADIKLDKLTLLLGNNNLGKSYIAKLVYCLFKFTQQTKPAPFLTSIPSAPSYVTSVFSNISQDIYEIALNKLRQEKNSDSNPMRLIFDYFMNLDKDSGKVILDEKLTKDVFEHLVRFNAHSNIERLLSLFSSLFLIGSNKALSDLRKNSNMKWRIVFSIQNKHSITISDNEDRLDVKLENEIKNFNLSIFVPLRLNNINFFVEEKNGENQKLIQSFTIDASEFLEGKDKTIDSKHTFRIPPDTFPEKNQTAIHLAIQFSSYLLNAFPQVAFWDFDNFNPIFLPAGRSGLLTSFNFVSREAIRSYGTSYENNSEQISEEVRDFFLMLQEAHEKETDISFSKILKKLNDLLDGKIVIPARTSIRNKIQYQRSDGKNHNMAEVSSMITELLPVIIAIKGNLLKKSSLLIIEEPESHLHPEAQSVLAMILINLVNSGIQLVITTHSHSFYNRITNLIIASQVESLEEIDAMGKLEEIDVLNPNNATLWELKRGKGNGSNLVEIPYKKEVNGYNDKFYDASNKQFIEFSQISSKKVRKSEPDDNTHSAI